MLKLARFIVDKRKAFYLIFLASFIFCAGLHQQGARQR